MPHEFFPESVRATLPTPNTQRKLDEQVIAYVKFFTPDSNWALYAAQFDPREQTLLGLAVGDLVEFTYFSLDDLHRYRGPRGLPIKRDIGWMPRTLGEIIDGLNDQFVFFSDPINL